MPFSVLISLYNGDNPLFFRQAIKSIYDDQYHKPSEVVLVIDGPINNELELEVKNINYIKNLNVLKLSKNVGLGNALNLGLEKCTNDIVARMDSDDISHPSRFKLQVEFLKKNPNISVLGAHIEEFDNSSNFNLIRKVPKTNHEIIKRSYYRNPLNHMTVIFRKSHVLMVGGYKKMLYYEDYYLWLRMIKHKMKLHNLNKVLVKVRAGKGMLKRRHGFKMFSYELIFLKKIVSESLIPIFPALVFFSSRSFARLININIFKIIYQKFLRSKV